VNTARKGKDIELIAAGGLRQENYHVHRMVKSSVKRGGQWIGNQSDAWGCIDLLAKKALERTRFIQVTAEDSIAQKKRDLATIPWNPVHDSVEIWRWIEGQPGRPTPTTPMGRYFRVYRLDDDFATWTCAGPYPVARKAKPRRIVDAHDRPP
jgi:hypothetical protein